MHTLFSTVYRLLLPFMFTFWKLCLETIDSKNYSFPMNFIFFSSKIVKYSVLAFFVRRTGRQCSGKDRWTTIFRWWFDDVERRIYSWNHVESIFIDATIQCGYTVGIRSTWTTCELSLDTNAAFWNIFVDRAYCVLDIASGC